MIEAILDIIRSLFTHGISWAAVIGFAVALSKFQKASRYKHWNAAVSQNQKKIMERLNIGDQWIGNGNTEILSKEQIKTFKKLYLLLRKEIHREHQLLRRKKFMERLKSRKLWIAIVSGILLVMKEGLDIEVDSATVIAFAGIMITGIGALAHVDAKKVQSGDGEKFH